MTVAPEIWTPVTFIPGQRRCDFCGSIIPGSGRRVAPAVPEVVGYLSAKRNVYECVSCRQEAARAARGEAECRASGVLGPDGYRGRQPVAEAS